MDHGLGPELVELRQAILRGVPSQDGSCDGPNGRADDPVRPNAALMQMLVSACMVSAEGIPAPKHESSPWGPLHIDPPAALCRADWKKGPPLWGGPSLGRK